MNGLRMLFAAATLTAALPASAATTINFDTLPNGSAVADGTPLGTQYASLGVTFTAKNGAAPGSPIATNYPSNPDTPYHSGNYLMNWAAPVLTATRFDLVSILFSTSVSNVSFGLDTFFTQGFATFKAYNSLGTLLQNVTLSANGGWELRSLTASGISRIDITTGTFANGSIYAFGVDQLTFTQDAAAAVPEPATWAMMVAGFGLMGGAIRRRARTAVTYA